MEDVIVTMETVAGLEDPGGERDLVLQLADGTRCTLARQDRRFAVWQRILDASRTEGMPVYVERTPPGLARVVLPVAARRVASLNPEPGGDRLDVALRGSAARHFVRTTRPDYEPLRRLLESAAEARNALLLAVEPGTLEILAARPPAEGQKVIVI